MDRHCQICNRDYRSQEEKQTDVNIAIHLFRSAIRDMHDIAVIVSGDSDHIPAIQAVKELYPNKQVRVAIPIGRRADELTTVIDHFMWIKEKQLRTCMLDDVIDMGDGKKIVRPPTWV